MRADERRIHARIEIDYTDPFLDQSIQVQASEQANVSYPKQTADAVSEPFAKIASLDGSWVLDGTYALAPAPDETDRYQMGWWGSQLAQTDGTFVQPYPTLTVTHFARPIHSLRVVGDSKWGEYPVDFKIELFGPDGTLLYTENVVGNTEVAWSKTLASPVLDVVKQVLTITKWSHAGRQVKILEFFTSIQEVYEGDDILLIHLLEEREVSQGSLPVGNISANEIDIRLNNSTRKFDAGNKQSPLYQLLKQNRRIKAWLGLKGDGEGTNLQQSVDFTQGTLNNLVVVNNKLQLPSVGSPSFSRNSIAYLSDGTLVNTNLPRYETGKFGNAIMIEEGTTNLIQNPSFENTIGSEWSVIQDVSLSRVSTSSKFGSYSAQVVATKDNSWGGIYQKYSVALGNKYTISVWVRALDTNSVGKNARVAFLGYNSSNATTTDIYYTYLTLPSDWTLYTLSVTVADSNTTQGMFRFQLNNTVTGCGAFVDGFQVEAKPYATSFIDGTRANETLTIPTAGVLNPQEGTVECWAKVINNDISLHTGAIFNGLDTKSCVPINIQKVANSNNIKLFYYNINNNLVQRDIQILDYAWHFYTLVWSGNTIKVYVDGVLKVTVSDYVGTAYTPVNNYVWIGRSGQSYECWNGLIDDLRISSRARTDAEIQAAYASGQPLPVDEWTTYKLNFDNNLNFGQGGSYISPEYDLSAVGTAATSAISWQEDPDGIQRSVYAKLDNQTDWTQVQNGGGLPVEGDLNGRKLQIKAVLLKQAS